MPRTTRPLDDDDMRAVVGSENVHSNMRIKQSDDTIPTTVLLDKKHDITTAASNDEDERNTDSEQIITLTTTTSRKVCLHTKITFSSIRRYQKDIFGYTLKLKFTSIFLLHFYLYMMAIHFFTQFLINA